MRLVRGRAATPAEDRAATATMLTRAGETGEEAFRAWTPHRQVAFGRRDTHADDYDLARRTARERGYAVVERSVGGRAVAYTGSTVAFAHAIPLDDPRRGLTERYEAGVDGVLVALSDLGVDADRGEPADSFCPGDHSVRLVGANGGGKVSGIAQRVQSDAALVAGCVLVNGREDLVDLLTPVYEALAVPFDPASVGTVEDAGGPGDPERACRALERAFIGTEDDPLVRMESVDALVSLAARDSDVA
ncbi:lipoate--protein ligase [Salinigranum rubrum]|uniref:Lipoate--protein ligase n=1 Tax=Salinigranum rubrum TaxID=755307 RepID=A0A2I8VMY6_9EURY|nr:lipoate--protein ligase family protein [Salinigranum rubrum]AUV83300.1 lipoate--protein ligase [Salinigranum rubrum]